MNENEAFIDLNAQIKTELVVDQYDDPENYCYGANGNPCVSQPIQNRKHYNGCCLECCKASNNGYCICDECTGKAPFKCFGTVVFECPFYLENGKRNLYKKQGLNKVCRSCNTLWTELSKFRYKLKYGKKKDIIPPMATYQIGKSVMDIIGKKPKPFIPQTPTPTARIPFRK